MKHDIETVGEASTEQDDQLKLEVAPRLSAHPMVRVGCHMIGGLLIK